MQPSFLRQSGWVTPSTFAMYAIHIVGCGAVGSNLALKLAKMGAQEFVLYDFDDVESHNLPNQAYFAEDIGKPKVDALERVLRSFNPQIKVRKYNGRFELEHAQEVESDIVCLAVDSLDTRGQIAELVRNNSEAVLMTDCRMGFKYAESYVFQPMDTGSYRTWKDTVVPDSEAQESPCNMQICATLVELVTAYCAHMVCNFAVDPTAKLKIKKQFVLDLDLFTT